MRSHVRRAVTQKARIESQDGLFARDCTMIDVSGGGACLVFTTCDPLPNEFVLILSHNGVVRRLCQPVWQDEMKAGVRFILK
jgi:hypothetical protein